MTTPQVTIPDLPAVASLTAGDVLVVTTAAGVTSKIDASNLGFTADGVLKVDTDTAITLAVQNQWYGWCYAQAGLYLNMTIDTATATTPAAADTIEPDTGHGGTYDVDFYLVAQNEGAQTVELEAILKINSTDGTDGTDTDITVVRSFTGGSSGSAATGDRIALSAGDTLSLWVRSTGAANREITIKDGSVLKLTRIRA